MKKTNKVRHPHDALNKSIFAEPRMIEDLLRGFFDSDWVHDLPPILPIVLYNGKDKWTASCDIRDVISPDLPAALLKYQPSFEYWLLDESRAKLDNELAGSDNLVSLLIQLEQIEDRAEAGKIAKRLVATFMAKPGADSLMRAFSVYLAKSMKIKEVAPDVDWNDITEVQHMLSDTVDKWIQGGFEKGMSQGMSQGISQGISQGKVLGERAIIDRQLTKKFGKLTPAQEALLSELSPSQLVLLSEKILFASHFEEVLDGLVVAELLHD